MHREDIVAIGNELLCYSKIEYKVSGVLMGYANGGWVCFPNFTEGKHKNCQM